MEKLAKLIIIFGVGLSALISFTIVASLLAGVVWLLRVVFGA